MIPSKKDPILPKYSYQLQILNRFSNFIANTGLDSTTKENAYKIIDCLKFIKINSDFIGYAVENRNDDSIYTYAQDKSKGVIRDFNNTAMHFNSYSSSALVQLGLKNLVAQFEQAIEAMQKKDELEAFAKKLHFDGDIGCVEARTAAALSFAATRLSSVVHSLDDKMHEFNSLLQNEHDPISIVNKAIDFFEPLMGQQAIWENTDYVINSALIMRYLTKILIINLPATIILDEFKKKEASPHHLALIEDINSQELTQVLLTPEYGLKFLKIVNLNQPSEVILALLHKIDTETIKKLFNENTSYFNIKFLNLLLKNHSAAVCETLLEKLSEQEINHFNTQFKKILVQRFKKLIKRSSLIIFIVIKSIMNDLIRNRVKIGIFGLIGLSFIILTALAVIGIPYILPILLVLTAFSLGFFPIIGISVASIFVAIPILALALLGVDFIHILINSFESTYKFHNLKQNLLHTVLALQSTRLLALFFSNLSSQQLNTLNFPLIDLQKRLPDLLFSSNLLVASEIEDTFYHYWYSNSALRSLLIDNEYPLLQECINNYFEGKLAKPHAKIILLFQECLIEKAKKQVLCDKEQAFLKDIKQDDQVFPQKSLEEIWLNGVESWSYYRYLRQKSDPSTQILLDRLLFKNELFGGGWSNESVNEEYLKDYELKQKEEQQAFETAQSCIETNNGLAKVIKPNNWRFFMRQLENPNHRDSSLRKSVPATNGTKKYVHLTDEVISYQKDRHSKPKTSYSHTKKTSTTLLSPRLLTFLFSSDGGILFDRQQCKIKALLLQNANTHEHEWVGEETSVNNYKTSIQGINETNEQRFIEEIQTKSIMNEVLAKLSKEALRAIIIQNNTPTERLRAIQRRDEIESKFSKRLPILFYKPAQSLETYTLLAQERDQDNEKKDIPRGNRLWINP